MSNAISKIQMVGTSKPYHGFSKLSKGYHEITRFRLVKSKYSKNSESDESGSGKSILVELRREILFLPQYFMQNLTESDIIELNSADEVQYLYFGGERNTKPNKSWIIRIVGYTQMLQELKEQDQISE